MNGIENPVVFYPAAVVMILCGILTIYLKNIMHAILSAVVVFFLAGMFFYVLGSEYNAIIQIAIYGVAVPVILGLGIMFTNLKNSYRAEDKNKTPVMKYLIILTGGIFILAIIYLLMTSYVILPDSFSYALPDETNSREVINSFASGIFIRYVWGFELVSIILTIIAAGLTMFKKRGGV